MKSGPQMWQCLRQRSSKKYLDFAEMLPEFNGGRIKKLQSIRIHQREEARKQFERSRPQDGISLSLDHLLLIELFPIEVYDDLEQQLRRLFSGDKRLEDGMEFIADSAEKLAGGAWCNIGHIVREKTSTSFLPFAQAALAELPSEVKLISVCVSKLLPSLFAISFDIDLTEQATRELNSLLNRQFLPSVTFGGVLATRRNLGNRSMSQSGYEMRAAVMTSLNALRLKVERALRSRFKGMFLRLPINGTPRLPAIELFCIKGVSFDSEDLGNVLTQNAAWADCFGLTQWRTYNIFSDSALIFQFPIDDRGDKGMAYKLVTFGKISDPPKPNDDDYFRLEEVVRQLTPLIAILELIRNVQESIERLRFKVYRTLAGGPTLQGLGKEIRLNNEVQFKQMVLDRLKFELKESRWLVEDAAQFFKDFVAFDKRQEKPLGSSFVNRIDLRLESLTNHSEVVSNALAAYLQRRNLDVSFRLQRRLFWWTISVSIVTVILSLITAYGLVKDWPSFQSAKNWVLPHLHW